MCSSQMDTQPKLLTKLSTIELKKELMEAAQKEGNNENDKYFIVLHTSYFCRKKTKRFEKITNWLCHEERRDIENKALKTGTKDRNGT